jgi:hypothetical protein
MKSQKILTHTLIHDDIGLKKGHGIPIECKTTICDYIDLIIRSFKHECRIFYLICVK